MDIDWHFCHAAFDSEVRDLGAVRGCTLANDFVGYARANRLRRTSSGRRPAPPVRLDEAVAVDYLAKSSGFARM